MTVSSYSGHLQSFFQDNTHHFIDDSKGNESEQQGIQGLPGTMQDHKVSLALKRYNT